jgi:hypothetical protein
VLAGVGANGPNYSAFAEAYLDPALTSTLLAGMSDYSKIVEQGDVALATWLQKQYGYSGGAAGAWTYFKTLPALQQDVFLRQIYFHQLNQGGLDFNDPSSVHYGSYVVGRDAIATLFPTEDAQGRPITYAGSVTMFSALNGAYFNFGNRQPFITDAGIHTDFGGDIQILKPGGQTIIGVEGVSPGAGAGLITQGSGNISHRS